MERETRIATSSKASRTIQIARAGLGQGDEPPEEVLRGREEFICSIFCPGGVHVWEAKICSGGFCTSNSEMNKELTNCHRPR